MLSYKIKTKIVCAICHFNERFKAYTTKQDSDVIDVKVNECSKMTNFVLLQHKLGFKIFRGLSFSWKYLIIKQILFNTYPGKPWFSRFFG